MTSKRMMLGNLRFIRSGEEEKDGGGMLKMASEEVRKKGVEPQWEGPGITKRDKGLVYVLDNFDCPDFKLLLGKCRIVGPAVVLAYLNKGWPLPASTQPIFSLAMRGVVACFTQTGARDKRERLSHLVLLMGGKVQKDYTRHVTHLIAGHVGSTKYNVARDLGMPVMLPSWVDHCWTAGLDSHISALDPDILKAHRCPPFTGCTVTVTGLEERERRKVRQAVEANGGVYSGELTKDVCTHLLVGSTTSAKYKFAQQWQIFCVSSQWLYDSAERGYCLSEANYSVGDRGGGGGVGEGEKKVADKGSGSGSGTPKPEWTGALGSYTIPTSPPTTAFLDGCKIFLSGFSEPQLQKLHKIVNLGGGARYNHLSDSLTHVVLGVQEPSTVTGIRNLGETLHVVSALWLLACCTEGGRVDEAQYTCLDLSEGVGSEGVSGEGKREGGKRKRRLEEGEGRGDGGKRPRVEAGEEDEDDNDETRLDEEALLLQYQNAEFPDVNVRGGAEERGPEDERKDSVLRGLKFAVSCLFPSEDQSIATAVLQEHGGDVVGVREAGYLLSPLEVVDRTAPGRQEELSSAASPVTMIWLQRSIEAGEVLEPSSNFLFQPLARKIVDTTLTDCVLAFSQFSDLEREHLIRFGKGLGAIVQDYFTHYPAHHLLATTHLVLKTPRGDKYTHALDWGVPAVADSWLFACAENGGIVPVEPHLLVHQSPREADDNLGTAGREGDGDRQKERARDEEEGGGEILNGGVEEEEEREEDGAGPYLQHEGGDEAGREEAGRVLEGVVLCVNKKIQAPADLHNLAGSLGADCHWSFRDSCTHYVYQGKAAEAVRDREVRAVRENGCVIVSPHWIHACVSEGRRVEEAAFPHTYNPNMVLSISISSSQQRRREAGPSRHEATELRKQSRTELRSGGSNKDRDTRGTIGESGGREKNDGGNKEDEKWEKEADDITSEVVRKVQQQLDEIKFAARDTKRRKSRRLQRQDPELSAPPLPPPPAPRQVHHHHHQEPRQRRSRRTRKREEITDSQKSDSQFLQVTYDDPVGRREKAKLLARIDREDKLRAQGLDPAQFRENSSSSSLEEPQWVLDIAHSETGTNTTPPHTATATHGQVSRGDELQTATGSRGGGVAGAESRGGGVAGAGSRGWGVAGGKGRNEVWEGDEGVSSTPLPPALHVPIVTHSKGHGEVKSLFDEKAMQTKRKAKTPPKFMLSALDAREKLDYGALIQELGGEYIEVEYYTNACTHLVVGRASRTEKFLGACAAGKWVLHKSYMEACRAERRFIEEEGYEWGVNTKEGGLQPLDSAPRRWRVALAQQRTVGDVETVSGAFHGWKVLLYCERSKTAGLRRLLEAGGATVFTNTTKLSEAELRQVSHAFISNAFIGNSHWPKDSLSVEELVQSGVACLKPEYIAEYLSKGDEVALELYFVKEAKPLEKRS